VLVVACDGLWDVMDDQEAVDFVTRVCSRGAHVDLAAQQLRDEALTRRSMDNISGTYYLCTVPCLRLIDDRKSGP
jgi:serine/threonine protein phosphatase PrpC